MQVYRCAFLLKKKLQHKCFLKKLLRTAFFCRTPHCSSYFFEILCNDIIFRTSLDIKLTFFIFLVLLLWFSPWSMVIPYLFSHQHFSHQHIYNIGSSTILIESLRFRKNSRTAVISSSNLLWKLWIWVFWILCFVIISL